VIVVMTNGICCILEGVVLVVMVVLVHLGVARWCNWWWPGGALGGDQVVHLVVARWCTWWWPGGAPGGE